MLENAPKYLSGSRDRKTPNSWAVREGFMPMAWKRCWGPSRHSRPQARHPGYPGSPEQSEKPGPRELPCWEGSKLWLCTPLTQPATSSSHSADHMQVQFSNGSCNTRTTSVWECYPTCRHQLWVPPGYPSSSRRLASSYELIASSSVHRGKGSCSINTDGLRTKS